MSKIDYDKFNATINYGGVFFLSPFSSALALMGVSMIANRYNWERSGFSLDDTEWNILEYEISNCLDALMNGQIGWIIPCVVASISNVYALPCDGGIYEREDYPRLYDTIDSTFVISGTQFRVPDLRDRVIVGAGSSYVVDESFGVDSVTLTLEQIPNHSHTYGYPSVGVDIEGAGVPDVTAVSNPPATLSTGGAGGGQAHENRQPSLALNWYIIAR